MAAAPPRSPLAPPDGPAPPALDGARLGAVAAGLRYRDRTDLTLIAFDRSVVAAGVLTRSACASAPVDWCRDVLPASRARAVLVNAGNANAFTGRSGAEACRASADALAERLGCDPREVCLASTGVIGEPLDAGPLVAALDDLVAAAHPDGWADAAAAIMTTDTYPKHATAAFEAGGRTFRINGIAKGSGMIAPDMATMLAFVATDAPVAAADLRAALARAADATFNAITVDSDTSTSDTLLAFATGEGHALEGDALAAFETSLIALCHDLAQAIVRDGEGATKLLEVTVTGAADDRAAGRIAMAIANSPLVKTAVAGEDANWGRVVMAVGKAGERADRDRLRIAFGPIGGEPLTVAREGARDPNYSEEAASAVMREAEIALAVDVGVGAGRARVWTCDLTHGYISINADYRS